ncbi:hypothetical protein Tco_0539854 [Tanacetum coccineum]
MSSSSSPSHVTVTYTFVSSDDDLPSWGIPLMEAYEPEAPLLPVHAPIYPEYLAPSDDDIAPTEDQPLPVPASPTALSPGYIADSEPIKDGPKEDPEMDPVDYPSDEEEPLAPSDSTSHIPDFAPSSEETKPFETDETVATLPPPISLHTTVPLSQTGLRRARKMVRPQPPLPPSIYALIEEWRTTPTSPSPSPSPLLPLSSPLPKIPSPPLLLPSHTRRDNITEAVMSLRKRASFTAPS